MTGSADRWRVIRTGSGNVYYNMALDEVLARSSTADFGSVFRIYTWDSPAITIGYAQRLAEFLNVHACKTAGIEVTRRLTGGRALFHVNEIAYTVVGRIDDPIFGGRIIDTYRVINHMIAQAFMNCGITEVTDTQPSADHVPPAFRRGAPCFASPTRYELTLNGMKVSGGAQRRFKGIFLQQGSVRLGPGAEHITDYLLDRDAADSYREVLTGDGDTGSDVIIAPEQFSKAFIEAFSAIIVEPVEHCTVTDTEEQAAHSLSETRYREKGWIYGDGSVDL